MVALAVTGCSGDDSNAADGGSGAPNQITTAVSPLEARDGSTEVGGDILVRDDDVDGAESTTTGAPDTPSDETTTPSRPEQSDSDGPESSDEPEATTSAAPTSTGPTSTLPPAVSLDDLASEPDDDGSVPVAAPKQDEIEITADAPDVPLDDLDVLSEEAGLACGGAERAIEALRVRDWPTYDRQIASTAPWAASASEDSISSLGDGFFADALGADPGPFLNEFINACVAEGYQL